MINESICSINNPPYALIEYHSIDTSNKEKLLNLPWMQQCLSGEAPANIAPSN